MYEVVFIALIVLCLSLCKTLLDQTARCTIYIIPKYKSIQCKLTLYRPAADNRNSSVWQRSRRIQVIGIYDVQAVSQAISGLLRGRNGDHL